MRTPDEIIQWLIESDPWTSYQTRKNLLHEKITPSIEKQYRKEIITNTKIQCLINELHNYFPELATRHTDSKLSHYKLRMLSDFGLSKDDGLDKIIHEVESHQNNNLYSIRQKLPLKDADQSIEWNALPCDNPLLLYALQKLGVENISISSQIELLKEKWETPIGWFCSLPFVNGQFKKEQIGCPMAGMLALEVFSINDDLKESKYSQNAYKTIMHHYEIGKSIYYFGRGKKFHTFKYPYVWYNALYMADVLTRFEFTKKDQLVKDLIKWIKDNADHQGKYYPTSIFLEYKEWDFGNKKKASPWITYLCYKILEQYNCS
jgi:hypothetical protein